jgi:hypothetical protein
MVYERRKAVHRRFIVGWLDCFKLGDMKSKQQRPDEWYRRRLRMCIRKCRKKVQTRFKNPGKCGIDKHKAWEWSNTQGGYRHIADSFILHRALNNDSLKRANYSILMDCYRKIVS